MAKLLPAISKLGVALSIASACASIAVAIYYIDYELGQWGSRCGTPHMYVCRCVRLWAPALSVAAVLGGGLALVTHAAPRTSRCAVILTLIVSWFTYFFVRGDIPWWQWLPSP